MPIVDQATSRRNFLQVPGREPAARRLRPRGLRQRDTVAAARPDGVGAAQSRQADRHPEGGHQRVRFRAGDGQERAAGAFRLHGVRHRRRGDAARQPRRLSEIRAAPAPAGRRQQGRHVGGAVRGEIQLADHDRADRRPQRLSPRRRRGRRPRRQDRRPRHDPVDPGDHLGQGHDRRARPADLVPALRHQQVRGRQAPRAERREPGRHRRRDHRRPQRRPQSGNPVPPAHDRHPRLQRLPRQFQPRRLAAEQADVRGRRPHGAPQHPVLGDDLGLCQAHPRRRPR